MRYIGLSQRVCVSSYQEKRDCLAHDWSRFLAQARLCWIAIPNDRVEAVRIATDLNLCGLVLTGGDDLGIHPERDATENALLDWSKQHGRPVIGVCRGFQVIHSWLGGEIATVRHELHVKTRHAIRFLSGATRLVNSYHSFAPSQPFGHIFPMEAVALCEDDNTIEAAQGENLFGMMWHPEREQVPDKQDIRRFQQHFPEACRD